MLFGRSHLFGRLEPRKSLTKTTCWKIPLLWDFPHLSQSQQKKEQEVTRRQNRSSETKKITQTESLKEEEFLNNLSKHISALSTISKQNLPYSGKHDELDHRATVPCVAGWISARMCPCVAGWISVRICPAWLGESLPECQRNLWNAGSRL